MTQEEKLKISLLEADLEIKQNHAKLLKAQTENEQARTANIYTNLARAKNREENK